MRKERLFLIDAEQGHILQTAFAGVSFEEGIPQGPFRRPVSLVWRARRNDPS